MRKVISNRFGLVVLLVIGALGVAGAAQLWLNTGTVANDGTGDTLHAAYNKINTNFTEVYSNIASSVSPIFNTNQFSVSGTGVALKSGLRTTNNNVFGAWTNNGSMDQNGVSRFHQNITMDPFILQIKGGGGILMGDGSGSPALIFDDSGTILNQVANQSWNFKGTPNTNTAARLSDPIGGVTEIDLQQLTLGSSGHLWIKGSGGTNAIMATDSGPVLYSGRNSSTPLDARTPDDAGVILNYWTAARLFGGLVPLTGTFSNNWSIDNYFNGNNIFNGPTTNNTLTSSRAVLTDANKRLVSATGTPDGTKFLRDDGVYAAPPGGGSSTNGLATTNYVNERFIANNNGGGTNESFYATTTVNGALARAPILLRDAIYNGTNDWQFTNIAQNVTFTVSNLTAGVRYTLSVSNPGTFTVSFANLGVNDWITHPGVAGVAVTNGITEYVFWRDPSLGKTNIVDMVQDTATVAGSSKVLITTNTQSVIAIDVVEANISKNNLGGGALTVVNGGTGAATAINARTNLSIALTNCVDFKPSSPAEGQLPFFNATIAQWTNGTPPYLTASSTIDAATATIKMKGYLVLTHPHNVDGTGAILQTNDPTKSYFGQALFANGTAASGNFVEYRLTVPEDVDTAVDLKVERLKFQLSGADTGTHRYVLSMVSVADSAAYSGTPANSVNCDFAGDASGASGDVETVSNVTLTNWKSNVTAGQLWVIRLARDGNNAADASTVNSYSGPLVISYGITQ